MQGPRVRMPATRRAFVGAALLMAAALAGGCGGGGSDPVQVEILAPSASGGFTVSAQEVRLGGTIAHASFLHVDNLTTASRWDGNVTYFDGQGTWLADVYGLVPGPNVLEVVADRDGTGRQLARARITITRRTP